VTIEAKIKHHAVECMCKVGESLQALGPFVLVGTCPARNWTKTLPFVKCLEDTKGTL